MLSIEEHAAGLREEVGIRFYQTMPPLPGEDFAAMRESIRSTGVTTPVIVDEDGNIIDGHHRAMICRELGIEYPQHVVSGLTEQQKLAKSVSLNIHRRQLTQEQKRQIIAQQVMVAPEKSNREHAKATGVSHHTVASVRDNLEATGQIAQLEKTVGADGKERPASKPVKSTHRETIVTEEIIEADPDTGEVIEPEPLTAPPTEPREPKPVIVDAGEANLENARDMSVSLGHALERLAFFAYPGHRSRMLSDWWPLGNDRVAHDAHKHYTPQGLRAIARGLELAASEMEAQR